MLLDTLGLQGHRGLWGQWSSAKVSGLTEHLWSRNTHAPVVSSGALGPETVCPSVISSPGGENFSSDILLFVYLSVLCSPGYLKLTL